MHPRRKGYSSLDELYAERDDVPWYWRVLALAASWLILGGYLVLPTTFDTDPKIRFSQGGLDALIAVFLISGYSLTVFLYFAVDNWLFQSESIFYPTLCSSAFGLIGVLYAFASSPRYSFDTAAGITVALSSSSAAVYAILLVWVQRKIARVRVGITTYQAGAGITVVEDVPHTPHDGRESQSSTAALYQDPNYYRNYIANMHPTAIRAPSLHNDGMSLHSLHEQTSYQSLQDPSPSPPRGNTAYYDPPRNLSTPDLAPVSPVRHAQIGEEEQVSQHLARLLLNTRDGEAGPNASQTTFRIDWRSEDDDTDSPGGIHMRTRTGSGSRLVPPGKLVQIPGQTNPALVRLAPFRGAEAERPGGSDVERGRPGAGRDGHRRAKSRDDRRKEIELGFVGLPPVGGRSGGEPSRLR